MTIEYRQLAAGEVPLLHQLLDCFSEAFELPEDYTDNRPDNGYLSDLLVEADKVFLVALSDGQVVGGLAAYVLKKFEQNRSEIYIYDLAVTTAHRRRGIATGLIEHLKPIAREKNAWVIFVQADYDDPPAVALYNKLGEQEEVLHFDIPVKPTPSVS